MKKTIGIIFEKKQGVDKETLNLIKFAINSFKDNYTVFLIGLNDNKWHHYLYDCTSNVDNWQNYIKRPLVFNFNNENKKIIEWQDTDYYEYYLDSVFMLSHDSNNKILNLIELLGYPMLGNSLSTSLQAQNYDLIYRLLSLHDIKVPKTVCLKKYSSKVNYLNLFTTNDYPLYLKSSNSLSSFKEIKIASSDQFESAITSAFTQESSVIIQKEPKGYHIQCSMMKPDFFQIESCEEIPAILQALIKHTADEIYCLLDCCAPIQIDFIITNNEIIFKKIDTCPDLIKFFQKNTENDFSSGFTW